MNLIALQKLLEKWNEEAEKHRICRDYQASNAYTKCVMDLANVIVQIEKAQPVDTTP